MSHIGQLDIGNNVFIWHFTILDTFNGVKSATTVKLERVSEFSHTAVITQYAFITTNITTLTLIHIKGGKKAVLKSAQILCWCQLYYYARHKNWQRLDSWCILICKWWISDFSIIAGNPAKKIGDVRPIDLKLLKQNPELIDGYLKAFQASSLDELMGDYLVK